jgi:hypothetical protein
LAKIEPQHVFVPRQPIPNGCERPRILGRSCYSFTGGSDRRSLWELKVGEFQPDIGKMQFYLAVLDKTVPLPDENPSIGILICKSKDRTILEYALKELSKPIGVASHRMCLPFRTIYATTSRTPIESSPYCATNPAPSPCREAGCPPHSFTESSGRESSLEGTRIRRLHSPSGTHHPTGLSGDLLAALGVTSVPSARVFGQRFA